MLKKDRLKADQTIFGQLRKKLTKINLVVMALLCLIMVCGTYFVMRTVIFNQSQQLLQIISSQAGSPVLNQNLRHDRHVARYFYVKLDTAGNILERSPDIPVTEEQLSSLLNSVKSRHSSRGQVEFDDASYAYLKVDNPNNSGELMAFVGLDRDEDTLWLLLITLSMIGLLYLVLAYFSGRFLAVRALQPIKESWQKQKDFVADASHELRTPLAVIQTNLELVKANSDETVLDQMKWLDYIGLETERLTKLVNDLLFLARADSNELLLDVKELSLADVIEDTVGPFRPMTEQYGLALNVSVLETVHVLGDKNRLKQLILILLDNSLKHTPKGGTISIKVQRWGNGGQIMVMDTGDGIDPEHLEHIFERFYRQDKARSKQTGGSGLGLAIAQSIVQSHGGTISVNSQLGKGTVFTLTLPGVC
ncbi:MAG: ATP-binding protein [Bacillota bacterium]|nr:ATP-binding protein [Bacillota bacterium]